MYKITGDEAAAMQRESLFQDREYFDKRMEDVYNEIRLAALKGQCAVDLQTEYWSRGRIGRKHVYPVLKEILEADGYEVMKYRLHKAYRVQVRWSRNYGHLPPLRPRNKEGNE